MIIEGKNDIQIINQDLAIMKITNKNNETYNIKISTKDIEKINQHRWYIKKIDTQSGCHFHVKTTIDYKKVFLPHLLLGENFLKNCKLKFVNGDNLDYTNGNVYTGNLFCLKEDYATIIINDKEALISIEDLGKVKKHSWYLNAAGYVLTKVIGKKNKEMFLHRYIMDVPEFSFEQVVDHINLNSLDNRRINLRICSNAQNCSNSNLYKNNTSGHTGVVWNKRQGAWSANIRVNYKRVFLGYFKSKEEAINARVKAEDVYFGEFANRQLRKVDGN